MGTGIYWIDGTESTVYNNPMPLAFILFAYKLGEGFNLQIALEPYNSYLYIRTNHPSGWRPWKQILG